VCLDLLADTRFFSLLLDVDQDLAAQAHARGCACGGPLYVANFARKPRGARGVLPAGFELRLSFCCGREGCRRRRTPPSVRFLGPKVYLAATIVLVTVLRQGPTPQRLAALREALGVEPATVARWRSWWHERFMPSPFARSLKARLAPGFDEHAVPASLLDAFAGPLAERLVALLGLLAPITTRPGLAVHAP
jgi:hypothetical protein